eukprot:jgi/Ulvmu1/7736/UM039_0044.1
MIWSSLAGVATRLTPRRCSVAVKMGIIWKNFISKQEARHIAELAAPHLKRSRVGTNHSSIEGRTSYGAFIMRYQDPIIAAVEDRAAAWTGVPVSHQEGLQVLRYSEGQTYNQHMDGMGRMCTMLIYLSDTLSGGETAFPKTNDSSWLDPALKPHDLSPCANGHVAVKPEIGTALLFYSLPPAADKDESLREQIDPAALHTGCPPTAGAGHGLKWTATIWTHVEPYGTFNDSMPKPGYPDPAVCKDTEPRCKAWADAGECARNKVYMVGEGGKGHCRHACGVCTLCDDDDEACWAAERERLGLLGHLEKELSTLYGDPA